jgi:hypothetical protein
MGYSWPMSQSTRRVLVLATVTLLLAMIAVVVVGGLWARDVAGTATAGKTQAEAGARSLAAQDATAATTHFAAASQDFSTARRALGSGGVGGIIKALPWAGRQYAAAQELLEIGLDGSSAGTQLAGALRGSPDTTAPLAPVSRFATVLDKGHANIESAMTSLADAVHRAAGLSSDGLVAPLARAVASVKSALQDAEPFLYRSQALLQLESYLLSGNHRILVISQDGAELRPTGGFPGTFGLIDVGSAGVRLESYHDVYTLPDPPGIVPPPPGATMTNDFSFRDAGWWIDFPTSARAMLGFWRTYRQPPVDGIVAIDTVAMKDLLGAVGPVHVSSYGETFTSENLLDRLLYLVEIKKQPTNAKKGVLTALAAELEKRMLGTSPSGLVKSAVALGKAADAKHVQMYFTDPQAEAAAESAGWSGRVAPPSGTTDVLAVSNAMNIPGKVNIAMTKTMAYKVALQPDRSAETTLVLSYSNTGPYPLGMPSRFGDWLRVYRAAGTTFPTTTPDGSATVTTTEFGFPAEVRAFILNRHQSRTETLIARVPNALLAETTPTAGGTGTAVYRLHVVRQDDLVDIPLTIAVTPPTGWHVTGASARLTASGAQLPETTGSDGAHLALPLSGDLDLVVRFAPN